MPTSLKEEERRGKVTQWLCHVFVGSWVIGVGDMGVNGMGGRFVR